MSFEQLNEILATPVPPLSTEQRPVVDDEYLLRRFIGPNADYYIAIYNTARAKNPDNPFRAMTWSWSWPAALCFLSWAMYRKLWMFGGGVTFVSIVFALLFPSAGSAPSISTALLTGTISNRVYLQSATKTIAKLKATSRSEEELLARVYRAGGVSNVGAWVGASVVVLAIVIGIIAGYNAALNTR